MSIITYNGESKVIKRICELLDTMTGISFVVVQTLPTTDIQTNVIYLVPKTTTEVDNIYDEYINTDGTSQGWELIGTTEIDLTNYVQFSDLSTVATSGDYDDLIDKPTIPTVNDGTLTIQLNGENQQTFTANSSSNKTADIQALDWFTNSDFGVKNLNSYPYNQTSITQSGVVFTDNGDGTILATGKSTSSVRSGFNCHSRVVGSDNPLILKNGTYILTGCPSGGSESSYYIEIGRTANGGNTRYGRDYGDGLTFTVNGDDNYADKAQIQLLPYCISQYQLPNDGIVFKPMIRKVEDVDNTWKPYAMTNRELTEVVNGVPTNSGTYSLKATRDASGNITYSWV